MAKTARKAASASKQRRAAPTEGGPGLAAQDVIQGPSFTRKNYVLLGGALAVIALGFVLLGQGSITLAPILLVIGYLVLVPIAIMKR